ncbi:hypothetical protein AKJ57_02005 [candidate division MSBL1 archaeon SCGC-AAA259A05]|uniref:Tagatose-bisphosphate aldolase n=1 Tax=candidate division MSBL1 archaeon SCGC-AAA259A05 TaxID=1698259 RepID=A0A133UAK0_9EURY|nr:hypothetical protein AKJ57_02005 [candidate division MSBL1 archaeon SCGC-AAA259A05]
MDFDTRSWLQNHKGKATLLGICPMSEEIVRAAFQEAAKEGFVPMFIATPRQVDADRGYTSWSQGRLVKFLDSTSEEVGYKDPYIVARDHGGPYQSRRDRGDPSVELEEAMIYAKELFARDVREGFDLIHVDATEDPRVEGIVDLGEVADRTHELITYIEKVREEEGLSEVYYEVGTEEITGGMTRPDDFERFIEMLFQRLENYGFDRVIEKILFVVGQVGTTMRIDMRNRFDPDQAERLLNVVFQHNLFLKVHYTDWLNGSDLKKFPELGIGAANVGPEFAASIIEGLEELERKERETIEGKEVEASDVMKAVEEAAIEEAPWRKFVPKGVEDRDLDNFAQKHRREIAICLGRYVYGSSEVEEAKRRLFENLKKYSDIENPDQYVVDKVRTFIRRFVKAFNLGGTV